LSGKMVHRWALKHSQQTCLLPKCSVLGALVTVSQVSITANRSFNSPLLISSTPGLACSEAPLTLHAASHSLT
jgi:hypothetical protein